MDETLKEKIQQLAKEAKVTFCKPLTSEEIQRMESRLRLSLPKEFLENFGCAEGWGLEIMGRVPTLREGHILPSGEESMSALGRTLDLREDFPTFPRNCIAVEYDSGDGYYCVVCGGKDNGAVIFWDMLCDPEEAYPNFPKPEWFEEHPGWTRGHITGRKEDFWVEAIDFWSWLIARLEETKREVEEMEEEGKSESKELGLSFLTPRSTQ